MLLTLTPHVCWFACHKRTKKVPTTMPPASLVSQCFHSVENQELPQIMLCFNDTWAVLCFWLCYSIHTTSSWRSSTGRLAMSVFLWCTSDLPTPYERKWCMTEILFLVFLFFWTVFSLPNKICILASSICIHNFNINWHSTEERWDYVEAQSNIMWEGSRLKSPSVWIMWITGLAVGGLHSKTARAAGFSFYWSSHWFPCSVLAKHPCICPSRVHPAI